MKRHRCYFLILSTMSLIFMNWGLKCRNPSQVPYDQDMEYAVRQCVRQMMSSNSSEQKGQGLYSTVREWERPHRDEPGVFRPSRDVANQNQENPSWLRERYPRPNRFSQEDREDEEFQRQPDRRRFRGRDRPHTVNQQNQYERDTRYNNNPNRRPMFQPEPNFNKPSSSDSRIASIDPCMIYCVFQELKMLDNRGELDKHAVMDQMTHRLRDREVRDFLQYTIEECLNDQEQAEERKYQHGKANNCKTAKNFAICMEDRGKQICEDWDEPMSSTEKMPPVENYQPTEREKPKVESGIKKGLKNTIRG